MWSCLKVLRRDQVVIELAAPSQGDAVNRVTIDG
jgi:hypothetical protein